jgi:uncharacterized membrane protein
MVVLYRRVCGIHHVRRHSAHIKQVPLKKSTFAIVTLSALLVGSNAWWAVKVMDGAISYTYLSASYDTASALSEQTKALVQVLTQPAASKSEILAAVERTAKTTDSYEKVGYTWVGQLGLKFNEQGRLVHVITSEDEAK